MLVQQQQPDVMHVDLERERDLVEHADGDGLCNGELDADSDGLCNGVLDPDGDGLCDGVHNPDLDRHWDGIHDELCQQYDNGDGN